MATALQLALTGTGTGVYTVSEAAFLLRIKPQTLRPWVTGYVMRRGELAKQYAPVVATTAEIAPLLTFRDLIELSFVREFRRAGVSMQEIRDAGAKLRAEFDTAYPFAIQRLQTDGRQLLMAAGEDYRRVATCQQVFGFAEQFFLELDTDENGLATVWWPMGRQHLVVLDPSRAFGAPIERRSGIRTDILYRAFEAEQDVDVVANWYEVQPDGVRDAVEFEERWRKAA